MTSLFIGESDWWNVLTSIRQMNLEITDVEVVWNFPFLEKKPHRVKRQIDDLNRIFNFCNRRQRNKVIRCKKFKYICSEQGTKTCVYQVACKKDIQTNLYDCPRPIHQFSSITCCKIQCKAGNGTCLNRKKK